MKGVCRRFAANCQCQLTFKHMHQCIVGVEVLDFDVRRFLLQSSVIITGSGVCVPLSRSELAESLISERLNGGHFCPKIHTSTIELCGRSTHLAFQFGVASFVSWIRSQFS